MILNILKPKKKGPSFLDKLLDPNFNQNPMLNHIKKDINDIKILNDKLNEAYKKPYENQE